MEYHRTNWMAAVFGSRARAPGKKNPGFQLQPGLPELNSESITPQPGLIRTQFIPSLCSDPADTPLISCTSLSPATAVHLGTYFVERFARNAGWYSQAVLHLAFT